MHLVKSLFVIVKFFGVDVLFLESEFRNFDFFHSGKLVLKLVFEIIFTGFFDIFKRELLVEILTLGLIFCLLEKIALKLFKLMVQA